MKHLATIAALLFALTVNAATLTLSWTDNSDNEDAFQIERSIGDDQSFALLATVPLDVTTYTDAEAIAGFPNFYRVRAINEYGESGYTNTSSATPVDDSLRDSPNSLIIEIQTKPKTRTITIDQDGNVTVEEISQ